MTSSSYERVPPLGHGREQYLPEDPWQRRAQQQAAQLDQLERKAKFGDLERYNVDAVLARPLSDTNRQWAEALKAKHGVPTAQRPLFQSVQRGQQQGGQQQGDGQSGKAAADYQLGAKIAQAVQDAFHDLDNR